MLIVTKYFGVVFLRQHSQSYWHMDISFCWRVCIISHMSIPASIHLGANQPDWSRTGKERTHAELNYYSPMPLLQHHSLHCQNNLYKCEQPFLYFLQVFITV